MTRTASTVAAVTSVLHALVLADVLDLAPETVAAIGAATSAVLLAAAAWLDPRVPIGKR